MSLTFPVPRGRRIIYLVCRGVEQRELIPHYVWEGRRFESCPRKESYVKFFLLGIIWTAYGMLLRKRVPGFVINVYYLPWAIPLIAITICAFLFPFSP